MAGVFVLIVVVDTELVILFENTSNLMVEEPRLPKNVNHEKSWRQAMGLAKEIRVWECDNCGKQELQQLKEYISGIAQENGNK